MQHMYMLQFVCLMSYMAFGAKMACLGYVLLMFCTIFGNKKSCLGYYKDVRHHIRIYTYTHTHTHTHIHVFELTPTRGEGRHTPRVYRAQLRLKTVFFTVG